MMLRRGSAVVEVKRLRFVEVDGMNRELVVIRRSCSYQRVKLNRGRHHESTVVVGVLSDEIHSARCAKDARLGGVPKALAKESIQQGRARRGRRAGCFLRYGVIRHKPMCSVRLLMFGNAAQLQLGRKLIRCNIAYHRVQQGGGVSILSVLMET